MRGYYNPTTGSVDLDQVVAHVAEFVHAEPESFYYLVIGTDSQSKGLNGTSEIDYVSAIIIHRKGQGARYFWKRERVKPAPLLRQKVYTETMKSLEVAHEVVPKIRAVLNGAKYDLEIHIDVGPKGKTREMIQEVVGMVTGNGFVAKTKPDSWGASKVADKHT